MDYLPFAPGGVGFITSTLWFITLWRRRKSARAGSQFASRRVSLPTLETLLYIDVFLMLLKLLCMAISPPENEPSSTAPTAYIYSIFTAFSYLFVPFTLLIYVAQTAADLAAFRFAVGISLFSCFILSCISCFLVYENSVDDHNLVVFILQWAYYFYPLIGYNALFFYYICHMRRHWKYVYLLIIVGIFWSLAGIADIILSLDIITFTLIQDGLQYLVRTPLLFFTTIEESQFWRRLRSYFQKYQKPIGDEYDILLDDVSVASTSTQPIFATPLIDFTKLQILEKRHNAYVGNYSRRGQVLIQNFTSCNLMPNSIHELSTTAFRSISLHHENLLELHGLCIQPPYLFTVHQHCNLGSLHFILRENRLTWFQKLNLLGQGARGLEHLHSKGFVHREVTARSFFVRGISLEDEPQVLLADFGSVCFNGDARPIPTETIHYVAPELFKVYDPSNPPEDNVSDYYPESDVYAFGVMMWEVWKGRLLWDWCSSNAEIIRNVQDDQRPKLKSCPIEYGRLMNEAWTKYPFDRCDMSRIVRQVHRMLVKDAFTQ